MKEKNGFIRLIESNGFMAFIFYPGIFCPLCPLYSFFENLLKDVVKGSYYHILLYLSISAIIFIWIFSLSSGIFFWLTNIITWISSLIISIVFYHKILSEIYFAFFIVHTILVIIRIKRMKLKI